MISDEVSDFKRGFKLNSDATFLDLHDVIIESTSYNNNEISSFIICDDEWNREVEIMFEDMGASSDDDIILMKDTPLSEYLDTEKQKLLFVFDFLSERAFYLELREITFDELINKPIITVSEGNAPSQYSELNDDIISTTLGGDDLIDEDFYGDEGYNEDELDLEGFESLDDLNL